MGNRCWGSRRGHQWAKRLEEQANQTDIVEKKETKYGIKDERRKVLTSMLATGAKHVFPSSEGGRIYVMHCRGKRVKQSKVYLVESHRGRS